MIHRFDSDHITETVGAVCLIINSICVNIWNAHQVDRGSQEKRERHRETEGERMEAGRASKSPPRQFPSMSNPDRLSAVYIFFFMCVCVAKLAERRGNN